MTRTMLKEKSLPKNFWAEAIACTSYLINRCPTKSVKNMTPQEAWSRQKPDVEHLRVFGCFAYAQVPEAKRKKLDDRGQKCIFIGYSGESKAYKLYNPQTNKIVVSRDVVFDKEGAWTWSKGDNDKGKGVLLDEPDEDLQSHVPEQQLHQDASVQTPTQGASSSSGVEIPVQSASSFRSSKFSSDSSTSSASATPIKMRSLQDIYDETEEDIYTNLFCLYADHEPLTFQEAVKEDI